MIFLLLLLVGIIGEWHDRSQSVHPLPYLAAALAAASMFLAAIMGHLAGWIMEFGPNFPPAIGNYLKFAGFASSDDFTGALVGSHSHEMAVAIMAMIAVLLALQFGYSASKGVSRALATIGVTMIAAGTVVVTAMYVTAAFTTWSPPAWFVSGPAGVNGIASDDVISGILVMGGGLLVAGALVVGRRLLRRPTRPAAAWTWLLSFVPATDFITALAAPAYGALQQRPFQWLQCDRHLHCDEFV